MTSVDPALVAKGLAERLGDVAAARDRYGSFAFTPAKEAPPATTAGEGRAAGEGTGAGEDTALAAHDLVVRALATLADPLNDRLAQRLLDGDATLGELGAALSLPHLVVWERLNDLIQVGLVRRAPDGDRAGLTAAGQALAALVAEIAARVAEAARGC